MSIQSINMKPLRLEVDNMVTVVGTEVPGLKQVELIPHTFSDFFNLIKELEPTDLQITAAANRIISSDIPNIVALKYWAKPQQSAYPVTKPKLTFAADIGDLVKADVSNKDLPMEDLLVMAMLSTALGELGLLDKKDSVMRVIRKEERLFVPIEEVIDDIVRLEMLSRVALCKPEMEAWKKDKKTESISLDIVSFVRAFKSQSYNTRINQEHLLSALAIARHVWTNVDLWRAYCIVPEIWKVVNIYDIMFRPWNDSSAHLSGLSEKLLSDNLAIFTSYFSAQSKGIAKFKLELISERKGLYKHFSITNTARKQPFLELITRNYSTPPVLESSIVKGVNGNLNWFTSQPVVEQEFRSAGDVAEASIKALEGQLEAACLGVSYRSKGVHLNFSVLDMVLGSEAEKSMLGLAYCMEIYQEECGGPYRYRTMISEAWPDAIVAEMVASGIDKGEIVSAAEAKVGMVSRIIDLSDPAFALNYVKVIDPVGAFKLGVQTITGLDRFYIAKAGGGTTYYTKSAALNLQYIKADDPKNATKPVFPIKLVGQYELPSGEIVPLTKEVEARKLLMAVDYTTETALVKNSTVAEMLHFRFSMISMQQSFLQTKLIRSNDREVTDNFELARLQLKRDLLTAYLSVAGKQGNMLRVVNKIRMLSNIDQHTFTDELVILRNVINLRLCFLNVCHQIHYKNVDSKSVPSELPYIEELLAYINDVAAESKLRANDYKNIIEQNGGIVISFGSPYTGVTA